MLHIVHAILSFLSSACCAVGIALGYWKWGWYQLTVPSLGYSVLISPFNSCTDTSGIRICAPVQFAASACTTKSVANDRWLGFQISTVAAGSIHFVLVFMLLSSTSTAKVVRILGTLFGFFAWAACITLFCLIVLRIHECNTTLCDTLVGGTTRSCAEGFTSMWWVMIGGAACSFLSLIMSFGAPSDPEGAEPAANEPIAQGGNQPPTAQNTQGGATGGQENNGQAGAQAGGNDQQQQSQGQEGASSNSQNGNQASNETAAAEGSGNQQTAQEQQPAEKAATKEAKDEPQLPEGDWVYDEESHMYWSEENYMFLHLETGQFYDPETDMWYDPELKEWYHFQEEGDAAQK